MSEDAARSKSSRCNLQGGATYVATLPVETKVDGRKIVLRGGDMPGGANKDCKALVGGDADLGGLVGVVGSIGGGGTALGGGAKKDCNESAAMVAGP